MVVVAAALVVVGMGWWGLYCDRKYLLRHIHQQFVNFFFCLYTKTFPLFLKDVAPSQDYL